MVGRRADGFNFPARLPIVFGERLRQAGTEHSLSSVGDSYGNALSESVIGPIKIDVTRPRGLLQQLERGD